MPVLTVSLKTWPQVGFSRKRSMRPSSLTTTTPNSSGFSTRLRAMVTMAPRCLWKATMSLRSKSVSASPLMTMNVSSRSSSSASLTLPAVPAGACSTEYCMRTPSVEPSPK